MPINQKYFERLLQSLNKEKNSFEKFMTVNEEYLHATYGVLYCIAKNKKLFTIGKGHSLPAATEMGKNTTWK